MQTPLSRTRQDDRHDQSGVIWVSRYLQVAVEAIIPIKASSGRDFGVRAQTHLYLPAILRHLDRQRRYSLASP
ncbi:hypothetical protein [Bradyrhizobium sp. URHD0069]|jgi:hypothetical protein|uniref:hypothetical protein n=1 Tax=Bradyrhizobium sp. URHD0069 TaxID=1380355 RepID=UPI0004972155|nr:hypothetical protein [Bradyrhizobium sp. URHD0069]